MSLLTAKSESILSNRIFYFLIFIAFLGGCYKQTPAVPPDGGTIGTPSPINIATSFPAESEGIAISEIQGAGHISPYRDQFVSDVPGIVTVTRSNGFYIQSDQPDHDPATSEGLFVFTKLVPSVRVGDRILLSGRVVEYVPGGGYGNLSTTEIENPEITILSRGNPLPDPIIIGEGGRMPPTEIIDDDTNGFVSDKIDFDPEKDGLDFYESLEGMLVQINNAVVVGPTNVFKEIVVLGDGGKYASLRTPRGGIILREHDANPERIILDDLLVELPFVNVGDYAIEPIVGVMDYDYGNYKFLVTQPPKFHSAGLLYSEPLVPAEDGQLRIASYNVENLSALQTQRLSVLAKQIVEYLKSPDIIALQEVQDNDGSDGQNAISADLTYQGIIDAILKEGGPQYAFTDIDPVPDADGGVPFGNIRVGYLYRMDRGLQLVDAPKGDAKSGVQIYDEAGGLELTLNPGRINPTHPAFSGSRKPLVAAFEFEGRRVFVVNNHLVSKLEDHALYGEFQPPVLHSEYQRIRQAQAIYDFVADLIKMDPDSHVIVLGDMNDFQFSTPIKVLKGDILVNLVETLPLEEQYNYNYEGNSQMLDHMLVSKSLEKALVSMEVFHLNSEFAYNKRFSDHDILIATFGWD